MLLPVRSALYRRRVPLQEQTYRASCSISLPISMSHSSEATALRGVACIGWWARHQQGGWASVRNDCRESSPGAHEVSLRGNRGWLQGATAARGADHAGKESHAGSRGG